MEVRGRRSAGWLPGDGGWGSDMAFTHAWSYSIELSFTSVDGSRGPALGPMAVRGRRMGLGHGFYARPVLLYGALFHLCGWKSGRGAWPGGCPGTVDGAWTWFLRTPGPVLLSSLPPPWLEVRPPGMEVSRLIPNCSTICLLSWFLSVCSPLPSCVPMISVIIPTCLSLPVVYISPVCPSLPVGSLVVVVRCWIYVVCSCHEVFLVPVVIRSCCRHVPMSSGYTSRSVIHVIVVTSCQFAFFEFTNKPWSKLHLVVLLHAPPDRDRMIRPPNQPALGPPSTTSSRCDARSTSEQVPAPWAPQLPSNLLLQHWTRGRHQTSLQRLRTRGRHQTRGHHRASPRRHWTHGRRRTSCQQRRTCGHRRTLSQLHLAPRPLLRRVMASAATHSHVF
nr:uncharacterized protein LOC125973197 [Syngnathus scovelli]XP_049583047.1 uncharacterized protein LOC125973197 [Syngnathus scovelli]